MRGGPYKGLSPPCDGYLPIHRGAMHAMRAAHLLSKVRQGSRR